MFEFEGTLPREGSELQSMRNLLLCSLAQNSIHSILNVTKVYICQKKDTQSNWQ